MPKKLSLQDVLALASRSGGADGSCWEWQGSICSNGYGRFGRRPAVIAHRFFYEHFVGPIPEGHDLDHLCRNRRCVNPAHLEPVTRRENLLRGDTIAARKAAQTHCVNGHEFTPENTRIRTNGTRDCRACHRVSDKARGRGRVAA